MSMQKCICSFSSKYSKLIPHAFQNKNHHRTYTLLTTERKEFRRLRSTLSGKICASAGPHVSAVKNEGKLKDNSPIQHQPLKFEDLSFDKPVPHDDLITALYKCKTVSEQMEMLVATLSLRPDDIRNRIKFCRTLESLFKPFFNDFKIQIFGSTVNGFGFKGCDIDLSFETSGEKTFETLDEKKRFIDESNVPLVCEVISGNITPQEISELPYKVKLHFIHNVLLEYYRDSEEPPIFINCHVPLVRFHHDKFGLKFDLTYKNKVAFSNSKLLYLYYKLDKRVAPFMMTIRYWAKHREIIGKGLMFNSYTISLMAIFFLQTRNPPILPSAESIIAMSDNFRDEDMVDKSFLNILERIPASKNEQSLEELLREFFFYYLYFDFDQVICPMTATAVPIEEFFSSDENSQFKKNSVCIQDPMCLKHNVAELVNYEYCTKLVHEMAVACNIFLNDDVLNPSSGPWGLINILDSPRDFGFKRLSSSKVVSFSVPLLSKSINGGTTDSERISATADTLLKILNAFLFTYKRLQTSEYLSLLKMQDELILEKKMKDAAVAKKKLFFGQIRQNLNKKVSEVIDVDAVSANNIEVEETMFKQFQKFYAENELVFCAECTIPKNVWYNRYLVKLDTIDDSLNVLEKEHLISSLTAEMNHKRKVTKPHLFLCECFVPKDRPDTLVINFRPHKKRFFLPIVGTFLKEFIPKIMRNISERN